MPYRPRASLATIISRLGLTSGLKLVLDAGEAASYTSGQSWLDLSGNGYDFFLGASNTPSTDDPTFNGTAGALTASEFWSFDGGDYFRYDSANEAWMGNIHKDNAKFTIIAWLYPNVGSNHVVLGNNGGAVTSGVGFHFGLQSDDKLFMRVANGGVGALGGTSTIGVTNAAWNFIGVTIDEAATTGAYQVNATQQAFTSTYTSPSAAAPSFTTEVGARGNASTPFPNGSRLAMVAAWEGVALSTAQMTSLYNATIAVSSMPVFHKGNRFFTRRF